MRKLKHETWLKYEHHVFHIIFACLRLLSVNSIILSADFLNSWLKLGISSSCCNWLHLLFLYGECGGYISNFKFFDYYSGCTWFFFKYLSFGKKTLLTCSLFKQCIFWGDIWCLCEVAAVKRWQETRETEQRCSCSCSASSALSHRGNPTPVFVRTNTCKHGCRMLTSQRTKVVKEEQLNRRLQELLLLLLQREVKFVMTYGWASLADEMTNHWLPS